MNIVILAAGQGKRMHSNLPKVLHPIAGLPMVGDKIAGFWHGVAVNGVAPLLANVKPYAGDALKWLASQAGGLGMVVIQFLLTVAVAGIAALVLWSLA